MVKHAITCHKFFSKMLSSGLDTCTLINELLQHTDKLLANDGFIGACLLCMCRLLLKCKTYSGPLLGGV